MPSAPPAPCSNHFLGRPISVSEIDELWRIVLFTQRHLQLLQRTLQLTRPDESNARRLIRLLNETRLCTSGAWKMTKVAIHPNDWSNVLTMNCILTRSAIFVAGKHR
ncbi:unnamed protein product [Soboliphyme baturini]|uniref:Uncharacterized protein n=1 Tax=Soboliphyme baturini TaxID=241478 RepID=A0A183IJK9_9BILA|nr:unnamed protein product [Soboliphyme baturini]